MRCGTNSACHLSLSCGLACSLAASQAAAQFSFGNEFSLAELLPAAGGDGSIGAVLNGIDGSLSPLLTMGGHDTSGSVVGASGDVNGDGVGDLLIGARNADPKGLNEAGESYVVFGVRGGLPAVFELSSLNGSNGFILNGVAAEDFSSTTLASAGDLNADGFDDVVVGAQFADPNGIFNAGQAYVFFGAPGPFPASIDLADLDGVTGFAINGNRQIDPVASSVASGGDLNADGVDDLIIGADGASLADDGSFSGPLSFSTDRRLWSTTWRSMMEFSRSSSSSIRPSM